MTSKLVCLIASHLNCNERVQNFNELLQIINAQKNCQEVNIFISLSHESDVNVVETLRQIRHYGFSLAYHKSKLSQFEHYDRLVKAFLIDYDPTNTWIIFSDDDDLWSKDRLYTCEACINNDKIPNSLVYFSLNCNEINNKSREKNYLDLCTRFEYIKLFFDQANSDVLKHKFCDLYFMYWLISYGDKYLTHAEMQLPNPIYIRKENNYGGKCSVVNKTLTIEDVIKYNFDIYMAQYHTKKTAKNFANFIKTNKICNHKKYSDIIKKTFNDNYNGHVFNLALPKYIPSGDPITKKELLTVPINQSPSFPTNN